MGLFGPFVHKSKTGQKFYLHVKEKGRARLYYFSKDSVGALNGLPPGFEVIENPRTGFPFLKRKTGGGLFGLFKPKQTEQQTQTPPAEQQQTT
jgi:hypothetical protein